MAYAPRHNVVAGILRGCRHMTLLTHTPNRESR